MLFYYEARNKARETITGIIEAPTKDEAVYQVYKKKLEIIKLEKKKKDKKVGDRDLILFTRVFSNGIEAKIPMTRSFEITMAEIPEKSALKRIAASVLTEIRAGKSLSEAFGLFPEVFPSYYISLIKAGEKSGKISRAISQVLSILSKSYEVKRKVLSAMLYPVFVLSFGLIVLFFFTNAIVPRFQQSYREMGGELPVFTGMIIGITGWFNANLFWIVPLLAVGGYLFYRWTRTEKGGLVYEKALLKIPVVGDLVKKNSVVQFSRAFSVLLGGGVTISDSLELLRNIVQLRQFKTLLQDASGRLSEGKKLSDAFQNSGFLPPALTQMIGMGEESGKLAELTGYLADFYEKELDISVERITSLLTPVLIVVIGLIVGVIAVALFLPIIEISNLVK